MKVFGLTGYPLGHSFSKKYFTEKFRREGIRDAAYELFPARNIDEIARIIRETPGLAGLNVTIPHKQSVIELLDEVDAATKEIGAVNVIKINRSNGKNTVKGFNTDHTAFGWSVKPLLKPHHKSALVFGTGGAARAAAYALKQMGIGVTLVSRKTVPGKAAPPECPVISYEEAGNVPIDEHHLIINATPLGMYPETKGFPPIPYHKISRRHLVFDMVYNPEETIFLKKAGERGAACKNGLEMLWLQAGESWDIWCGKAGKKP